MKNKKILLCLIPLFMTACAEPTLVSDTDIVTPATNIKVEMDSDSNTDIPEESVIDETEVTRIKEPRTCSVHTLEYHFFPSVFIDYIGDEFYDWIHEMEKTPDNDLTDECPYSHGNIIECLKYFNISEEEFTKLYYTSLYYNEIYDPYIMYNGSESEIQEFFLEDMTGEKNQEFEKRIDIWFAKLDLRLKLSEMTVDEQIIEKYQELPLTAWTFADIICDAQISRSTFEEFLAEPNSRSFKDAFDVDAIYNQVESTENIGMAELNAANSGETMLERCLYNIEYEKQFIADDNLIS